MAKTGGKPPHFELGGVRMPASRFDPEGIEGPAGLRLTGWAWYAVESALFLVGTDDAEPDRRPALQDSGPAPFWRVSDLARIVELGDDDPWRERVAREILGAVVADLAADPGLGGFKGR